MNCLECGETILGRSDKKFCNDACRNAYNNRVNSDYTNLMRMIHNRLRNNYGLLYLSDQSSPEEIKAELGMSKKNFKKAIGGLYKDQLIEIFEDKIRLR